MTRRLGILVLLLALGAIVNVAVAWGCARASHFVGWREIEDAAEVASIVLPDGPSRFDLLVGMENRWVGCSQIRVQVRWYDPYDENAQSSLHTGDVDAWRAGWPSYSMIGWIRDFEGGSPSNTGCCVLISPNNEYLGVAPYLPHWPGFAINTAFYAAILWLLFAAPFTLRRRLRVNRGLCPKCAYPVGDSPVCTECGAAVLRQKAETQKAEMT